MNSFHWIPNKTTEYSFEIGRRFYLFLVYFEKLYLVFYGKNDLYPELQSKKRSITF